MKFKLFIIGTLLICNSCNNNYETLLLYNDSDRLVYFIFNYEYPDTIIPVSNEYLRKLIDIQGIVLMQLKI